MESLSSGSAPNDIGNFNYGGSTLESMRRVAALHAAAFFAPDAVERRRVRLAAAAALEGGVLVGLVPRGGAGGSVSRERFSSVTDLVRRPLGYDKSR